MNTSCRASLRGSGGFPGCGTCFLAAATLAGKQGDQQQDEADTRDASGGWYQQPYSA
jgi:hypothetical protein